MHDLVAGPGDAGEMLDAQVRRSYRARLTELRAELEQAEEFDVAALTCSCTPDPRLPIVWRT